jgi:integrase
LAKKEHVYNQFFTEEKWEKVNIENKNIMEDYTIELKSQGKSKGTILQYRNDWRIVFILISEKFGNKSILDLKKKDWRNLLFYLKSEKNMSNSRINRLRSAISSMMNYCEDDDDYEYDFSTIQKVKGLPSNVVTRESKFLTDDQIFKLKDELMKREEYQKLTLLFLAYDSAGRKNELLQVKKECFEDESNRITNTVIGKRGKKFFLMYFDETIKAAKLYLEQRGKDDLEEMWLSIDKDGNKKPVTGDTLYTWFKSMNKILTEIEGEDLDFSTHSLRHSSLENMSNEVHTHYCLKLPYVNRPDGFSLDELKLQANHESVETTAGYLKNKDSERKLSMFGLQKEEIEDENKEL